MATPAISFVQSASIISGGGDVVTLSFASGNSAGNAILVLAIQQRGSATSFKVTDTNKNAYRDLGFLSNGASVGLLAVGQLFFAANIAADPPPSNNVISIDGSPTAIIIHEISGVNAVDVTRSGVGAGNSQSSGNVNTNFANEFLFGWHLGSSLSLLSINGEAGWIVTQSDIDHSFLTQYRIVAAQGSYASTTITTTNKGSNNNWIEQIVTLFFSPNAQPRVQGVSQANVGLQLYPNYNNISWTQPGGKGTQVFPAQARNAPFTAFPVPGQVIDEVGLSLWNVWGCGHGSDVVRVFKDFDNVTGLSAAAICCPVCSYIQFLIEPYENATSSIAMTNQFPIIIP